VLVPWRSRALARVCVVVMSVALLAAAAPRAHGVAAPSRTPAARAIAWAERLDGSARYAWYCERFVENAFGTGGLYETAWDAARAIGLRRGAAPRGALVYFRPDPTNHGYGHVGISLGGGRMISALARVMVTRLAGNRYWSALYAGWAPVPRSWLVPDSWSSSHRLTGSP